MQKHQAVVRSAWENFMNDCPVSAAIRPVVLASWRRSREQQAPTQSTRTQVFDLPATRRLSERNRELLQASGPVLEHARRWLPGTKSMLLLTDMDGTVLRVTGDGRAIGQGQEVGLQQGGRWRERDIGTNAIGTALAMNAPVRIHAFEHFCQHIQPWSCAAAPVRDPWSGRPLGVVDISCAARHANEQSLAYATMLAQRLHAELRQRRQDQHQHILQHLLQQLSRWRGHDVVAFDRRGHIIYQSAGELLENTPLKPLLDAGGALGMLADTPSAQWMSALHEAWPDARWEGVQRGDDWIGAWLVLPRHALRAGMAPADVAHAAPRAVADASAAANAFDDTLPGVTEGASSRAAMRESELLRVPVVGQEPAHDEPRQGGEAGAARDDAGGTATAAGASVRVRHDDMPAGLRHAFSGIIGQSSVLRDAVNLSMQMARHDLPLLLEGETGTGKEMFAQAIHAASARTGAFVPINCGALPPELVGSELFGYERGSFTGASPSGHAGKFEVADRGTLCLDEIGELPLGLQPYLLRVLEDQQVYRLGSHRSRSVNVRLIAMTHRRLEDEIQAGRFREDLFFRIAVARVFIPPLRERAEDIPLLVRHFAHRAAQKHHRAEPSFTQAALDCLSSFGWPGNIRQLRNTIERLVALGDGGWIDVESLPPELRGGGRELPSSGGGMWGDLRGVSIGSQPAAVRPALHGVNEPGVGLARFRESTVAGAADAGLPSGSLKEIEWQAIQRMIAVCRGNHAEAARRLGIARSTLYSRLQKAGQRS